MASISSLWILMLVFRLALGQQAPLSPCPRIFQYENDGIQWFGSIQVPSPPFGSRIQTKVKMSIGVQLPTRYVGRLELLGDRGDVIQQMLVGGYLRYRVHFPVFSPLPRVTSITLNNRILCQGPPDRGVYVTSINLDHSLSTEKVNDGTGGSYVQPGEYNQDTGAGNTIIVDGDQIIFGNNQPTTTTRRPLPFNSLAGYEIQELELVPTGNGQYNVVYNKRPNPDDFARPVKVEAPTLAPPTTTLPSVVSRITIPPNTFQCGITHQISNPLVIGGETVERGDWPWLVAIFVKKISGVEFICAGSLVSNRHVVTAAHCVHEKGNRPVRVNELVLKVGVFNIQDWTDEETKTLGVSKVELHPEFNGEQILATDITVLVMSRTVTFNEYIIPVCLWETDTNQSNVYGKTGSVVGWGRDENGLKATPEPRLTQIPIVSSETCRASRIEFQQLTNNKTLCAGSRDGTGPCNGDSGGGLFMQNNNRWVLRGVVSNSLKDPNSFNTCNLHEYLIFTDAAMYTQWIKDIIQKPAT